jgi:hypothetical protein
MNLDKLFKHLADEHGLLLLESEKREIADCLPKCTCEQSNDVIEEKVIKTQPKYLRYFLTLLLALLLIRCSYQKGGILTTK